MRGVTLWIYLCVYLNCAGWVLSALHELNAGGYAFTLVLALVGWLIWWKRSGSPLLPEFRWPKLRRRFKRGFPRAFLVLALMAFLGGVLYAPSNYDALAYRVPRVIHWLDAGQWHWINTIFPRLNQRCCGIEWVSAPVLTFSHSFRGLFLINIVSFLFLPGLVFSVFTRLGVRPRVAWYWMWLVPTGYGFLLQAASIGNDLFGATFVLGAMDFALRAKASRASQDFFASILAAALMTSAKPSNLPLLLPWALAMAPSAALILRWPMRTVLIAVAAALASFLPTALLNTHFCGDWTGLKVETGISSVNPLFLAGTNTFLLILTNFNPPVCPFAGWWNVFFAHHLPAALATRWEHTMEAGLRAFDLGDLQMEESAGIGFGICALVVFSMLTVWIARPKITGRDLSLWLRLVRWSPVISVLVIMAHSSVAAIGREILPYYALLLPLTLTQSGQAWLTSRWWWRRAAGLVFILATIPLVLSPPRPLFPVLTVCNHLNHVPARVKSVYTVYRERPDGFAPVKAILPGDARVLGFVGYDDPEASLWQPHGSRRVEHVLPSDSAADLKARGIHYVLIHSHCVDIWFHEPLSAWLQEHDAQIVQTIPLNLRASTGPQDWNLVKLN